MATLVCPSCLLRVSLPVVAELERELPAHASDKVCRDFVHVGCQNGRIVAAVRDA